MSNLKNTMQNSRERLNYNPESGQAVLIAVILSVSISMLILFAMAIPVSDQIRNSGDYLSSKQTLINSESLNDEVLYRLNNNKNIPSVLNMSTLGDTTYSVVAEWDSNTKQVISNSVYQGFTRKIEAVFIANRSVNFDFGAWLSSGGLEMENSARISGNVFSIGKVTKSSSAIITGTLSTSTTAVNLPISDSDINNWKTQASSGKVINGGMVLSSKATTTTGPLKIIGDLSLTNTSSLTLNGPLYVTGNLSLTNSSRIQLSPSYGTKSETIVVDGRITLGNSSYLGGSGQVGSTVLLATQNTGGCETSTCTATNNPAINLTNSSEASAILLAPNGAVYLSNSAETKTVLAKFLHMTNSSEVSYDSHIVNTSFNTSTSTSWSMSSLKEI